MNRLNPHRKTAQDFFYPHQKKWGVKKLKSSVYQVTGRAYGQGECFDRVPVDETVEHNGRRYKVKSKAEPTAHFIELLDQVKEIIDMRGYKDVAVITHKDVEPFAREYLGLAKADTLHFFGMRGRNDFKRKEVLFVLGTPSPSERSVKNLALELDPRRVEPFYKLDPDGKPKPNYIPTQYEYWLSPAGLALWQQTRGSQYTAAARMVNTYRDPVMSIALASIRDAELYQAVMRARPLTNPADVWLFSSVPINYPIDGLFDDAPITPGRFAWKLWRKVKAWHDAQPVGAVYGYEEIHQATGADLKYLKNIKALDTIQEFYGSAVERVREAKGRGRPVEKIRKTSQK